MPPQSFWWSTDGASKAAMGAAGDGCWPACCRRRGYRQAPAHRCCWQRDHDVLDVFSRKVLCIRVGPPQPVAIGAVEQAWCGGGEGFETQNH